MKKQLQARSTDLTKREREVLQNFALGHIHVANGEKLGIKKPTVEAFLQRIKEKRRCRSRADLVALAIEEGLL